MTGSDAVPGSDAGSGKDAMPRRDAVPGSDSRPGATDACAALCALADRLAARSADRLAHAAGGLADHRARRDGTTRRYLIEFGRGGAGIPTGPLWFVAAGAGGRNVLRGRGFRPELDDGSNGQARHFAGIVATAARIGAPATRWLSIHVRRDALDTADGRLTEVALEFVAGIHSGDIARTDASSWLRTRLCA